MAFCLSSNCTDQTLDKNHGSGGQGLRVSEWFENRRGGVVVVVEVVVVVVVVVVVAVVAVEVIVIVEVSAEWFSASSCSTLAAGAIQRSSSSTYSGKPWPSSQR